MDIAIIGGGPSGLTAAMKLKQLNPELEITIYEKASTIGGHLISGAILQKDEYIKYISEYPMNSSIPIGEENLWLLSKNSCLDLIKCIPEKIKNKGNMLISINEMCKNMANKAISLGINVCTECGVKGLLIYNDSVIGITLSHDANINCDHTIIAEGPCGLLTSKLLKYYNMPYKITYALGIREEWISQHNNAGTIYHTMGWPSNESNNWGGGFIYIYRASLAIGYITYLDYRNHYVNPCSDFERFKKHASINNILWNAKKITYGAKLIAINDNNKQINTSYPGCTLIGCTLGLVDSARLKGLHNALISGERAAENYILSTYKSITNKANNWIDLKMACSLRRSKYINDILRKYGLIIYRIYNIINKLANINKYISNINNQWPPRDWNVKDIRSSSLVFSNLKYRNGTHISVKNDIQHRVYDLKLNDKLTNCFCPAQVYLWGKHLKHYIFKIQYTNCLQCKSCIVKTANYTINWNICSGGWGPNYNV